MNDTPGSCAHLNRWRLHPGITLAVFLVSLFQLADFDIFWHLKIGEIFWKSGQILDCNRFSWTFPEHLWQPTYWLFEAIVYPVFALAGSTGLILAKAAILAVAWGSLAGFYEARTGAASRKTPYAWGLLIVFIAAVDVSLFRFMFRPHIYSFLGLALLIQILERWHENPNRREVWWQLPLLFLLWSNLHSGVVFGYAYFGIFLAAAGVEALRRHKLKLFSRAVLKNEPLLARGAVLVLLTVVAGLINPTGPGLFYYVYDHLTMEQVIQLEELEPFRIAAHPKATAVMAWFILLPLLLLGSCRKLKIEPVLRSLFCLYLLSKGVRFIPKVCLFCLPTVFEALAACRAAYPNSGLWRCTPGNGAGFWRHRLALYLLAPLLYAGYVHARTYRLPESCFRTGFGISAESFPVAAAACLPERLEQGLYNSFGVGGYLIWRFDEQVKVFQDGRIHAYPLDFFRKIEPLRSTGPGCVQLLAEYGIREVLLRKKEDVVLAIVISRDPAWETRFEDDEFVYAVRK